MKKFKKVSILFISLLLMTFMVSACTKVEPEKTTDAGVTEGASDNADTSADNTAATATAKITGSFLSPAVMSYTNMRPTYNYYLTTINDQKLTTFDDGTYCLTVHSTQFSAIVLPEEGDSFSANEKVNYFTDYYGTYTQAVDELDSDMLSITLSKPTRITDTYDSTYFVDTANWTDDMSTKMTELRKAQQAQYAQYAKDKGEAQPTEVETVTAESYLAEKGFDEITIPATVSTSSMEYTQLKEEASMGQ